MLQKTKKLNNYVSNELLISNQQINISNKKITILNKKNQAHT